MNERMDGCIWNERTRLSVICQCTHAQVSSACMPLPPMCSIASTLKCLNQHSRHACRGRVPERSENKIHHTIPTVSRMSKTHHEEVQRGYQRCIWQLHGVQFLLHLNGPLLHECFHIWHAVADVHSTAWLALHNQHYMLYCHYIKTSSSK